MQLDAVRAMAGPQAKLRGERTERIRGTRTDGIRGNGGNSNFGPSPFPRVHVQVKHVCFGGGLYI